MRKNIWLAMALMFGMTALGACGTRNENKNMEEVSQEEERQEEQKPEDAAAEEETAEAGGNIYVEVKQSKMEFEAEDGTVVLTVDRTVPVVTISNHAESAEAINEYINSAFPEYDEEMLEIAKETYADLGKENWRRYASGETFASERTDSAVISFTATYYWDMGGAHPNSGRCGLNFSTETGKILTLEDVVIDKEAATAAINDFILEETKKEEYGGMFFEGYEESIGDILTEDSWYLGDEGFHIIVNEYIISPHAAGIMDFVIPYGEAGFLKEEFRK